VPAGRENVPKRETLRVAKGVSPRELQAGAADARAQHATAILLDRPSARSLH